MSGQIQFKVDTSSVGAMLPAKASAIINALTERTTAVNAALQAKIAGQVLQGEVLKSHTNKLAGSVRVVPTSTSGTTISGGVQAGGGPAFYAKFLEDGTQGPYVIAPKDPKGVLAFMVGGKMMFARKVIHPGLKPFLFMKGTLEAERGNIVSSLQEAAREAAQ